MTKAKAVFLLACLFVISILCWVFLSPKKNTEKIEISIKPFIDKTSQECSEFTNSLPKDYKHQCIEVPENWGEPDGKRINVCYYTNLNSSKSKNHMYLFLNGGPGESSFQSYSLLEPTIKTQPDLAISMVYMDQRGTGCSSKIAADLPRDQYKKLSHYSSRDIVKDAEAIRSKLLGKDTKWGLFGHSYGALIAARYIEIAPQSLTRVVTHGYAPAENYLDTLANRLKAQNHLAQEYLSKNQDAEKILQRIAKEISPNRCYSSKTWRVCGSDVINAALIYLKSSSLKDSLQPYLQKIIKDGKIRWKLVDILVDGMLFPNYDSSTPLVDAVSEIELHGGFSMADPSGCDSAQEELKKQGLSPSKWLLNECRLLAIPTSSEKQVYDTKLARDPLSLEKIADSLKEYKIPYFLFASKQDFTSSPASYEKTTLQLENIVHFEVLDNSGHEGYRTEDAVWRALAAKSDEAPVVK